MSVCEHDVSRELALAIAASIGHSCPSPRAEDYGRMAATMVGALVAADDSGHGAAVAHARQMAERLYGISAVCPENHRCGLCPLTERLLDILRTRH